MEKPLITIGFDKNGEADFGIRDDLSELSLEKFNELRQIIPVAIYVAEDGWHREQERRQPANKALSRPQEQITLTSN
jgi:hypothetical protein